MLCRDDWTVDTAKSVPAYRSMYDVHEEMAMTARNGEGLTQQGSRSAKHKDRFLHKKE